MGWERGAGLAVKGMRDAYGNGTVVCFDCVRASPLAVTLDNSFVRCYH